MSIEKLLKYQELDMQRLEIESNFSALPESKTFNDCKSRLKLAQANVIKLNNDAEEMIRNIENLIAQYDKANLALAEAEEYANHISDKKGAEYYAKNVDAILATINQLSKDISNLISKIGDSKTQYEKTIEIGSEAKKKGKEIEPKYLEQLSIVKKQINGIIDQMKVLAKDIEPDKLESYNSLRQRTTKKIVVALKGKNCGGCYTELASANLEKLNSFGSIIVCPNCNKLVFKEKNN